MILGRYLLKPSGIRNRSLFVGPTCKHCARIEIGLLTFSRAITCFAFWLPACVRFFCHTQQHFPRSCRGLRFPYHSARGSERLFSRTDVHIETIGPRQSPLAPGSLLNNDRAPCNLGRILHAFPLVVISGAVAVSEMILLKLRRLD